MQRVSRSGLSIGDADDAIARWVNKHTGYVHPKSSIKPEARNVDFLESHDWTIPTDSIEALCAQAHDKPVILCGVGGIEAHANHLFRAMFALVIDDETLINRLTTRTTNCWGKQAHELERTLSWQQPAREDYQKYGNVIIDATQPIEVVTDQILDHIQAFEQCDLAN